MISIVLLLLSILFIIYSTTKFKLHPFLALLIAAIAFGLFAGIPLNEIAQVINAGFGGTIGHIGIVIIFGSIIGKFLERSGGAFVIAESFLKYVGEKHVPLAMALVGYVVSIPVFADSGFVLLSPLNRALSKRADISLAGSAIALSLGLTTTHTLVPPTPGPIAAAGLLEADLGLVILLALPISLFVLCTAWLFARYRAAKIYIDPYSEPSHELISSKTDRTPGVGRAVLPIFLPILLIVIKSVSDLPAHPMGTGFIHDIIGFAGEPVIALLIGVIFAATLPHFDISTLSTSGWVGRALMDAALIILITGAGGAFGKILQASDIATTIGDFFSGVRWGIWLPFLLAAAIKTSQGSSTVAIITAASILAPLMATMGNFSDIGRALVVLSIGAGSMVVSHANDSFFWVVTQMSNMDVRTGYKLHSAGTLVIGTSALFIIWLLSLFIL